MPKLDNTGEPATRWLLGLLANGLADWYTPVPMDDGTREWLGLPARRGNTFSVDEVMQAADRAGERYWQIPLVDEYLTELESWYADIVNSGTAEGSLVKSGLFLREFRTKPWVHLDIGGSAYFRKPAPYAARGATGVAHATLVELALAGAKDARH